MLQLLHKLTSKAGATDAKRVRNVVDMVTFIIAFCAPDPNNTG